MARAKAKASIGYEKIHPTQKPVELYDFCFQFAKLEAGAKVLDTHLGSGSSRISANKNGLNFVGCEIDEDNVFGLGEVAFVRWLVCRKAILPNPCYMKCRLIYDEAQLEH
jgi:hypothetical protein